MGTVLYFVFFVLKFFFFLSVGFMEPIKQNMENDPDSLPVQNVRMGMRIDLLCIHVCHRHLNILETYLVGFTSCM